MRKVHILIGVPGSGKSTLIKNNSEVGDLIISSDSIREEINGDEANQDNAAAVWRLFYDRLALGLILTPSNIWLDATNVNRKDRIKLVQYVKSIRPDVEIHYEILKTPLPIAYARNQSRNRVVPNEVILRMYNMFAKEEWRNEPVTRLHIHESL